MLRWFDIDAVVQAANAHAVLLQGRAEAEHWRAAVATKIAFYARAGLIVFEHALFVFYLHEFGRHRCHRIEGRATGFLAIVAMAQGDVIESFQIDGVFHRTAQATSVEHGSPLRLCVCYGLDFNAAR